MFAGPPNAPFVPQVAFFTASVVGLLVPTSTNWYSLNFVVVEG
jgi:hypothetical protein